MWWECTCNCRCLFWPEALGSPIAGVTGRYELPDVDTGNWTEVLWKSSMCSHPLSHLFNPNLAFEIWSKKVSLCSMRCVLWHLTLEHSTRVHMKETCLWEQGLILYNSCLPMMLSYIQCEKVREIQEGKEIFLSYHCGRVGIVSLTERGYID